MHNKPVRNVDHGNEYREQHERCPLDRASNPNLRGFFLTLTLDGKQVANVALGRTYDAYVSPGQHVLTAVHTPNISAQIPASVTFTAENGKTYSFIAQWQDDDVVLVRDLGAVRTYE